MVSLSLHTKMLSHIPETYIQIQIRGKRPWLGLR